VIAKQQYWLFFVSRRWLCVRTCQLRNVRLLSEQSLVSCTDAPIINTGQALVDLYTATNGPKWKYNTNWLNGDPCSKKWYGVTCSSNTISQLYVTRSYSVRAR